MDDGRFIRCRNCGAIHRVTPFDSSPVFKFVAGEGKLSVPSTRILWALASIPVPDGNTSYCPLEEATVDALMVK